MAILINTYYTAAEFTFTAATELQDTIYNTLLSVGLSPAEPPSGYTYACEDTSTGFFWYSKVTSAYLDMYVRNTIQPGIPSSNLECKIKYSLSITMASFGNSWVLGSNSSSGVSACTGLLQARPLLSPSSNVTLILRKDSLHAPNPTSTVAVPLTLPAAGLDDLSTTCTLLDTYASVPGYGICRVLDTFAYASKTTSIKAASIVKIAGETYCAPMDLNIGVYNSQALIMRLT